MTEALRKSVLRNAAWFLGIILVVSLLVGGALLRLRSRNASAAQLQIDIQNTRQELILRAATETHSTALETAQATLLDWRDMLASGSRRVAALSSAARVAGVTIAGLRGVEPAAREDSGASEDPAASEDIVAVRSHELEGVGDHRQLAAFFDGIYSMPGMAGIDELRIEPRDGADPGVLQASLRVSWYAPETADKEEGGTAPQ